MAGPATPTADFIPEDSQFYQAQDAIASATRNGLIVGTAGLLMSAVQNSMQRANVGAFGIIGRFGGTIAYTTAVGASYGFVSAASANLREKDDFWAQVHGGVAAGAILGLRKRAAASVAGNMLLVGTAMGVMQYSGSFVLGGMSSTEPDMDATGYKEEMRRRFRRPINEVVNEIGEGRGIYPPGYGERRRERIKANYGIDVAEQPYYQGVSAANKP